jgi:hypothetical protein
MTMEQKQAIVAHRTIGSVIEAKAWPSVQGDMELKRAQDLLNEWQSTSKISEI